MSQQLLDEIGTTSLKMQSAIGAILILKFFAWIDLIVGLVGALVIWSSYSTKTILTSTYFNSTEKVLDPIGVAVGIAVLLQGLFVCALFLVIASIAENLNTIRRNTTPK